MAPELIPVDPAPLEVKEPELLPISGGSLPISTEEMRISKSPLEIVLLDDMAGQLYEMIEIMSKHIHLGRIDTFSIQVLTTDFVSHKIGWPWMSFSVTNDGPGIIEFFVNRITQRASVINPGEVLNFDFKFPVVEYVWVRLQAAGVSNLRFFGVY